MRLRQRRITQRQLPASAWPTAHFEPGIPRGPVGLPQAAAQDDDGLGQRCREQWRRGDWAKLCELPLDEVERHPQRARLALMVASAHQARGSHDQTRRLALMALQWGGDPDLVARVLLAGVHNTLGRAAVASGRHRERALHHFGQAVAPGGPRSARRMALQARVRAQLEQMHLGHEVEPLMSGGRVEALPPVPAVGTPLRDLRQALRQQGVQLTAQLTEQTKRLSSLRSHVEASLKKEVGNAVKQLEAFSNLQRYLGDQHIVPELHGWPISPDFGVLLLSLIEQNDYDLVIEFGSGTSTLLMATALDRLAARRATAGKRRPVLLTLEHLAQYHEQTAALLDKAGLRESVHLALAPIQPYQAPDGQTYPYYDARDVVRQVASALGTPTSLRALLVVDGPPSATGPRARYPALPLALEFLAGARIDVLLDDYFREDEKQIAQAWMDELQQRGLDPVLTVKPLEKDACLISF